MLTADAVRRTEVVVGVACSGKSVHSRVDGAVAAWVAQVVAGWR